MVQHRVKVDPDPDLVGLVAQIDQLFLRAPFGPNASFLVEFTKIVQVIDIVAIPGRAAGLAGGRDPCAYSSAPVAYRGGRQTDVIDAGGLQARQSILQPLPVFLVLGHIPLEALQHGKIVGRGFASVLMGLRLLACE